jgi:hypothetical protein
MDFEQIKVIWDTQNAEPLYAIDEAGLHGIVQRRNRDFARREARRYWREILLGLVFGAMTFVLAVIHGWGNAALLASIDWVTRPVSRWDVAALFGSSALWFYYAAYVFRIQKRQEENELNYADTLRGEIDRSLARTAFLTRIARDILWPALVPIWGAALLSVITIFRLKGAELPHFLGMFGAMIVALVIAVLWEQRRIARHFEPRRRELESLRQKLIDEER